MYQMIGERKRNASDDDENIHDITHPHRISWWWEKMLWCKLWDINITRNTYIHWMHDMFFLVSYSQLSLQIPSPNSLCCTTTASEEKWWPYDAWARKRTTCMENEWRVNRCSPSFSLSPIQHFLADVLSPSRIERMRVFSSCQKCVGGFQSWKRG